MTSLLSALRAVIDKLGFRLAAVLAVALLPLMIVSIARSQSVINEALARSQSALVGETLRAVGQEVVLIERANAAAQSLAQSVLILLDDPARCSQVMKANLADTVFSFAGFYDLTGYVPCSSADAPFSFGMSPDLATQIADPRPMVLVNEDAPISGTSVIYASHPVRDQTGQLIGFVGVSVPHTRLGTQDNAVADAQFMTVTIDGTILTAPGDLSQAEALLPVLDAGQTLFAMPTSFEAKGHDGQPRLYAVVPLVAEKLYAVATWLNEDEIAGGFHFSYPALFPVLMWLASLAVASFAATLFVTRHVINLRRAMTAFANRRTLPDMKTFSDAPAELREVASSYRGMTDTLLRDEARIEDELRQKDVLLREVHHRVKNNLQLITSIMGMQMRQTSSPEVRAMMRGLHDRVNSLATIHRNLYQTSGQADIQMDEHLRSIVDQVLRMGAEKSSSIDTATDLAPLRLNPDQAVPLSLFVTEAMTNALKYIGADPPNKPALTVELTTPTPQTARVQILNTLPAQVETPDSNKSSGLGSELMEAFADQLMGEMTRSAEDGQFVVSLTFEVEELEAKQI